MRSRVDTILNPNINDIVSLNPTCITVKKQPFPVFLCSKEKKLPQAILSSVFIFGSSIFTKWWHVSMLSSEFLHYRDNVDLFSSRSMVDFLRNKEKNSSECHISQLSYLEVFLICIVAPFCYVYGWFIIPDIRILEGICRNTLCDLLASTM